MVPVNYLNKNCKFEYRLPFGINDWLIDWFGSGQFGFRQGP